MVTPNVPSFYPQKSGGVPSPASSLPFPAFPRLKVKELLLDMNEACDLGQPATLSFPFLI